MEINKELLKSVIAHPTKTIPSVMKTFAIGEMEARRYIFVAENMEEIAAVFETDKELVEQNVRYKKQQQKFADLNRIERKSFREHARVENTLSALNEALINELKEISLSIPPVNTQLSPNSRNAAIVQLSDAHFNELVDLPNNQYDFKVASKRLQKYAGEVKTILKPYGVNKIVFAMTGDMLNSDRRLDEKLSMATNRMRATMFSVKLIQNFINDLLNDFENMDVIYVTGNESRSGEEYGFSDTLVTDNYDTVIFNILGLLYENVDRVNFLHTNPVETVITINGKNVLVLHGTTIKSDSQAGIQQIIGKYSAKGILIDYVIFGHVHFANITDLYARSGSLVGNNVYSDYGINLVTRASQNVHLIKENGQINNFRIELNNTDDFEGYEIEELLDVYNAKSSSKLYPGYKVLEIVI